MTVVKLLVCNNKILAAYSLALRLDIMNRIQSDHPTKSHAEAFESYIAGVFLANGETNTIQYLEELMTPLLTILLANSTNPAADDIVISDYFGMEWLAY